MAQRKAIEREALPPGAVLDNLVTPTELVARLSATGDDVAVKTLEYWRTTGEGPRYIRVGKSPRYWLPDVDEWLLSRRYSSTPDEPRSRSTAAIAVLASDFKGR